MENFQLDYGTFKPKNFEMLPTEDSVLGGSFKPVRFSEKQKRRIRKLAVKAEKNCGKRRTPQS